MTSRRILGGCTGPSNGRGTASIQLWRRGGQRPAAETAPGTEPDAGNLNLATTAPPERSSLPLLLTADEVAALLRTTRKAVYAMAERAALPGVIRLGRRILVDRDELLRWLDEKRAPSPGRTRR